VYFYHTGHDRLNQVVRHDATSSRSGVSHVGGGLGFGNDGKLHLGLGDNAQPANTTDLSNPRGKILRIYRTARFRRTTLSSASRAKLDAIWAHGMSNPGGSRSTVHPAISAGRSRPCQ
jgi:glucose/arabinose dehydrogenase